MSVALTVLVVLVLLVLAAVVMAERVPALRPWVPAVRLVVRRRGPGASPQRIAAQLRRARRVVVVPGYGLAAARAQHLLRALIDALEAGGARVEVALHPVAGRVPGHLDALLDGAGVRREQLVPADTVDLAGSVALVVGANDVVNPDLGIVVPDLAAAEAVVVLTDVVGPGAAGVANPSLGDERHLVLLGDARGSLASLVAAVHI